MIGFLGEYEATLDSKGRFLLPGGLKRQIPEGENHFVISIIKFLFHIIIQNFFFIFSSANKLIFDINFT